MNASFHYLTGSSMLLHSFIWKCINRFFFAQSQFSMQIARHVNNKWHTSTFYDRIFETTTINLLEWIRTEQQQQQQKIKFRRKWYSNEIPRANLWLSNLERYTHLLKLFAIATSNAFQKLKQKQKQMLTEKKKQRWRK